MKKSILIILAVTLVAIFSFHALSIAKKPSVSKTAVDKSELETSKVSGEVIRTDLKKLILTIAIIKGNKLDVIVDANTTITKMGKNISLAGIRKGDLVVVSYNKKGKPKARSIIVQGATVVPKTKSKR